MSQRYSHQVTITFEKRRNECGVGNVNSHYKYGGDYEDTFRFEHDSFTLTAQRSRKHDDNAILSNSANIINAQILKGLLFYYSLANDFPRIKSVSIVSDTEKQEENEARRYVKAGEEFLQPITDTGVKPWSFLRDDITVLFEESDKGSAIRIALSYWLKAVASKERYYKFDHLWRAYNRLFRYQGNQSKESDNMKEMRQWVLGNSGSFTNTISITNSYTSGVLRSFRWRKMILNDYDTESKTKVFVDFVTRHHDVRIMDLLNEMLPYREEYLKNANLLNGVKAHIAANRNHHDAELVTLLSLKYAYFVRNKMFHGEIPDSTFKMHKDEIDTEIDRLNEILTSLVFEIIKNNRLLR